VHGKVSTVTWYEGVVGAGVLVLLVLLALSTRVLNRGDGASRSQTIETSEPASNVHIRADVRREVTPGGIGTADRKGLAGYLLKELRREGLLPASNAERTPQAAARLAYQEKEAGFLIAKAIDSLAEREKAVITLQFSERLPASDLARQLGVSTSTVYRLRRNALKVLADAVAPAFEVP
jgi:RNA polymerase sigma factor (sigma-70 family)